jgi:hypothetical protein
MTYWYLAYLAAGKHRQDADDLWALRLKVPRFTAF